MNELTKEYMTIRDFCNMTGRNAITIHRAIKKLYPDKMKRGKTTKINKTESDELLKELRVKDLPNLHKNVEVEQVEESTLTKKDIELISTIVSMTVAQTIKQLDNRMNIIENKYEERKSLLPAPKKHDRANLNEIVRSYAEKNEMFHSLVWSLIYKEAYYRLNVNFKLHAKRENKTIIDYIEENGYLSDVLAIALEVLN